MDCNEDKEEHPRLALPGYHVPKCLKPTVVTVSYVEKGLGEVNVIPTPSSSLVEAYTHVILRVER